MLSPEEKANIREAIEKKMLEVKSRIEEYKELTKPIPPDVAIGRISRMDAINNKSVNEAALRQAESMLIGLERALQRLPEDHFGLCGRCGNQIPTGRILLMPGATRCVQCA